MVPDSNEEINAGHEKQENQKNLKSREILVNFNRRDYEEVYFKNMSRTSYNKKMRSQIVTISTITVLVLALFVISYVGSSRLIFAPAIFVFYIYILYNYIKIIRHKLKWRYSIDKYLDSLSKYKSMRYIVSENGLTEMNDDQERFTRWSEYMEVSIQDNQITLQGTQSHLIPKKAISAEDYSYLKAKIDEKVKNGL